MATSLAGSPVIKHTCSPGGCSNGKHRRVAPVSSLICFSCSSDPSQPPRAHLPSSTALLSSSYDVTSTMFWSRNSLASSKSLACTSARSAVRCAVSCSGSTGTPNSFPSLPRTSRRATTHASLATSLGPTSMRTGAPFISQKEKRQPGVFCVSESTLTRRPAVWHTASICAAEASTASRSASVFHMGTTTTWNGASAGGRRSPKSSPCVMITPPTIRVETPHDV
mmetsp:Transcript_12762/g.42097  ORF Transcript_12762/g.42097 Transcript_12762/m.42097 type:complete len:224 (-) Transcript_12762:1057-1728(-)